MNTAAITTAIVTATGERVEIVAVNGGWTTVQTMDAATREFKVRNGALSGHAALSGITAELAMQKAETVRTYNADGTGPVAKVKAAKAAKEPAAPKAPRAKMDPSERKNGAVDPLYLPQYTTYSAVRKDGTKIRSIDKGDAIALALRGADLITVYKDVAAATGTAIVELRERFAHLNPGMQRMNLGNMLRRATR
jgi:hypothetical protein